LVGVAKKRSNFKRKTCVWSGGRAGPGNWLQMGNWGGPPNSERGKKLGEKKAKGFCPKELQPLSQNSIKSGTSEVKFRRERGGKTPLVYTGHFRGQVSRERWSRQLNNRGGELGTWPSQRSSQGGEKKQQKKPKAKKVLKGQWKGPPNLHSGGKKKGVKMVKRGSESG